jgi:hypothetical protein
MIVIVLGLVGAFIGWRTAMKRGGNRKDIAQHMVGFAMAFLIVGMVLTVILDRILSAT